MYSYSYGYSYSYLIISIYIYIYILLCFVCYLFVAGRTALKSTRACPRAGGIGNSQTCLFEHVKAC